MNKICNIIKMTVQKRRYLLHHYIYIYIYIYICVSYTNTDNDLVTTINISRGTVTTHRQKVQLPHHLLTKSMWPGIFRQLSQCWGGIRPQVCPPWGETFCPARVRGYLRTHEVAGDLCICRLVLWWRVWFLLWQTQFDLSTVPII